MRYTTGDTTLDAVVLLGVVAILLGALLLLAVPSETTEVGRRWTRRLAEWVFGDLPDGIDL